MVEEAKESSATRAFVLAKDFNLPQSESTAWLPQANIVNLETFDLDEFTGAFIYPETTLQKQQTFVRQPYCSKSRTTKRRIFIRTIGYLKVSWR